ncbi:MT-A70-domain-containing protein [Blakeslea trispora]|nr:MT-A70-domain-containing protein [Blakeslea trispora]
MFDLIDSESCFSKRIKPYKLIPGEFDVCSPYFRAKEVNEQEPERKRRRKNKTESHQSNADIETEEKHQMIRTQLLECLNKLSEKWPEQWKERKAPCTRDTEVNTIDFPSIQQMVEMANQKFAFDPTEEAEQEAPFHELAEDQTKTLDMFSVFGRICKNSSTELVKWIQFTPTATYLIPPDSTFFMGSMSNTLSQLGTYVETLGGADLIVMDPPWPNKSVQRSSHYDTQDIYDFYKIPMSKLISGQDSIVAVWVTNKPKFRKFVINKLFPAWQLECLGEWVWLKTTTQAECIFPLDSKHKKPYEQLIIGRPLVHNKKELRKSIPKTHTIISVPSVRHSRKPPLEDVLSPFIEKKSPVCIELFARCLMPGWISWGNECLKFQHSNYFEDSK